jgi:hypothetical protein
MAIVIVLVLVVFIGAPAAYLGWRFARGGAPVAGGSFGSQLFGRKTDDWGPK